jgi:hypothetical protein
MFSWHISLLSYTTLSKRTTRSTQYTHSNFTNCALADSCVCCYVSILVRFKFFDGMEPGIFVLALCFIDPTVSPRGDETKNGVFECDTTMSFVALGTVNLHHIMWYCLRPAVNHERKRKWSMMAVIRQPVPVRLTPRHPRPILRSITAQNLVHMPRRRVSYYYDRQVSHYCAHKC